MGEGAILIAGYKMYAFLQSLGNAPAPRAALAPVGKGSSVFMSLEEKGGKKGSHVWNFE
jgi:hypothetical protein